MAQSATRSTQGSDEGGGRASHLTMSWKQWRRCLPSIVTKEQTTGGDEEADHDGWRRRASDIVGLVPAHGDGHGDGVWGVNPGLQALRRPFASRRAAAEARVSTMADRRVTGRWSRRSDERECFREEERTQKIGRQKREAGRQAGKNAAATSVTDGSG